MHETMKYICTLLVVPFFLSCSFNKAFLKPDKFPREAKRIKLTNHVTGDSVIVRFSGDNFQPVFTGSKNEVPGNNYSIESVVFNNDKGSRLNGWLLKPTDGRPAGITILHLHGNEGSLLVQYKAISPLVGNGIQVFTFDYSGFGFSERTATQQQVHADALAALDYVRGRPDVKNTRIVIYGQSLGGHLAAVVAAERQEMIAGLVTEGAFSSPKDIGAYMVRKSIGLGFVGRLLVKSNYSAKASIKNYHKPLLVIHSTEDQEVPFFMGRRLYDQANEPKEFYQILGPHIAGPARYSDTISLKIRAMER